MRVIEPLPRRTKAKSTGSRVAFGLTALIAIILSSFLFVMRKNQQNSSTLGSTDQNSDARSARTDQNLKFFSAYDFQKLYDQTAYPNTNQLADLPAITGNQEADIRIRKIAESRGYKPQLVPAQAIVKVADISDGTGNLLQPLAYDGWQKLLQLAVKDNVPLKAKLGYQSIEKQRELFLNRLSSEGAAVNKVAKGEADDRVIAALFAVAPPGYSRHQTGFAIDFTCDVPGITAFELSVCSNWLKDNNYNKSKQAGFIPSQVEKIGPPNLDPQTAEYVWVGTSALY